MGKILIIADIEGDGIATPRGLELAQRLGHTVEVYAFVYAPLGRLKLGATEKAVVRKKLLAEREALVQSRIDRFASDGQ